MLKQIDLTVQNSKFVAELFDALFSGKPHKKTLTSFEDSHFSKQLEYYYEIVVSNQLPLDLEIEFFGGVLAEEKSACLVEEQNSKEPQNQRYRIEQNQRVSLLGVTYISEVVFQHQPETAKKPLTMNLYDMTREETIFQAEGICLENRRTMTCELKDPNQSQKRIINITVKVENSQLVVYLEPKVMLYNELSRSIWVKFQTLENDNML